MESCAPHRIIYHQYTWSGGFGLVFRCVGGGVLFPFRVGLGNLDVLLLPSAIVQLTAYHFFSFSNKTLVVCFVACLTGWPF